MAYPDLYKKSIFIEIVSLNDAGEPQNVEQSMALTIPPSSIEINQTQRITKTPTPGGFFVDDYGLGSANISLGGETGNEEARLTIFGPGKTPGYLTGQDVWFEFRNRIVRYSQKNENYSMRFYDLTHKGSVNIFRKGSFDKVAKHTEAWEVVLDDTTLKRGSQKPFFYPYSINMTGIRPLGTFNPKLAKNEVGFLSDVRNAIDNVNAKITAFKANLEVFLSDSLEYVNDVNDIVKSVSSLTTQFASFTNLFLEYEQKIGNLFGEVISETEDILNAGVQLVSFPYDALDTARTVLLETRTKVETLVASAKTGGQAVLDKYDWSKTTDPVSDISQSMTDIETPFYTIMHTAKQDSSYEPIGGVALNGVVTPIYGFSPYTIKGNTSLGRIARDNFGDPDFKDIISGINGIYSDDELVVGGELKLPVLQPNIRFATNAVYNIPEERNDILGRDAKVNSNGIFVTNPSDYSFTSKNETVSQAVFFRLSEKKGRQLRDGTYGVVAQIGEALSNEAPFEFLSVSLEETLVQDPRITDVYGLNFLADGDKIYQSFKFDTITRESVSYKEGI